jgi:hypothetical protein
MQTEKLRIVHDETRLRSLGFTELDIAPDADLPTYGKMVKLHREADVKWCGIASFRTASGWKFFRHPAAEQGFIEEAMFPKGTI